jgi:hypothetical protein
LAVRQWRYLLHVGVAGKVVGMATRRRLLSEG